MRKEAGLSAARRAATGEIVNRQEKSDGDNKSRVVSCACLLCVLCRSCVWVKPDDIALASPNRKSNTTVAHAPVR